MFCKAMRELRTMKGMSILELSRKTEISPSDISQIELGKKTCYPSWRKRIAEALDKKEQEIFPEYFTMEEE